MEALARLQAEYRDRGMVVLLIPTDPKVTGPEMESIMKQDFDLPGVDNFLWCLDPTGETVLALDPMGIGGTVIVDRQGRISFRGRMTHTYEELKEEIERAG